MTILVAGVWAVGESGSRASTSPRARTRSVTLYSAGGPRNHGGSALELAHPTVRLRPGERVGLFWELYEFSDDDGPVTISLDLRGENGGRVRRFARALRLIGEQENVGMQWQARLDSGAVTAHYLELELSDLPAGEYALTLTTRGTRGEVTSTRVIRVVR